MDEAALAAYMPQGDVTGAGNPLDLDDIKVPQKKILSEQAIPYQIGWQQDSR